jgi:hypothetical protein
VALGIGLLASRCSSSTTAPTTDQLAKEIATAFCAHQFACCTAPEIAELAAGRYATMDQCVSHAQLSAQQQLALLESEVAWGPITIDATAEQSCIAAYQTATCNVDVSGAAPVSPVPDVGSLLSACPGAIVGTVPAGLQCHFQEECAAKSRCTTGASVLATSSGGNFGSTGAAGSFGQIPVPGSGAIGVCLAYQKIGEPCNASADCDPAASLYCHRPDYVCAPMVGEGAPCGFTSDGSFDFSPACDGAQGLVCDTSQLVCRRFPGAGEPCAASSPQCDPAPELGLACNFFTGLCTAPAAEGQACGGSALAPCEANLSCVAQQPDGIGTCGQPPVAGQPCRDRCVAPAICQRGTCTTPGTVSIGNACSVDLDCATLACLNGVCGQTGLPVVCAGNKVTPGFDNMGIGGIGGNVGAGGSFDGFGGTFGGTGTAGAFGSGSGGAPVAGSSGTAPTGAGGAGGMSGGGPTGAGGMTGGGGTTGAGGSGSGST